MAHKNQFKKVIIQPDTNVSVRKGQKIVKQCLVEYGKYVLEDRAVPDFRDGLKPVQRRLLYSLYENGYFHNKSPKKSADVVGYTLGKYHPHGDSSCYDALVTMVNSRYPMVEGSGNWGTIGGDPAAAYRYTECRLFEVAHWLFDCMEVARFCPNYDDTRKEPVILPSRLPMFFMNGSEGIAVGIRSCIPPFNLTETIDALIYIIKNWDEEITARQLQKIMKAPDYGRGILLSSNREVAEVYENGTGSLTFGCKVESHDGKDEGVQEIVITSYAPQFNVVTFIEECDEMASKGLIEYVHEGTDKSGHRIIVGYKNSMILEKNVLPLLEKTVSYFFYVTRRGKVDPVSGKVEVQVIKTTMLPLLRGWIKYRTSVETKFLNLEIKKVIEKISKEEAYLIAIRNIDFVVNTIRKKDNPELILKTRLKLNDFQVQAILEMTLRSLKKKNEKDIQVKIKGLQKDLKALQHKLKHIDEFIIELLEAIKESVIPDTRGTELKKQSVEIKGEQTGGIYVISNGSNLRKLSRVTGNFKLSHVTKDGEGVTTISDHGFIGHWNLMSIPDGDVEGVYTPIVGLVPYSKQKLIILTNMGNICVIEHPQDRDNYKAVKLRDKEYATKAIGIAEGEKLIAISRHHTKVVPFEKLKCHRNNSQSYKIIPDDKIDIMVMNRNSVLMDDKGNKIKRPPEEGGRIFVMNEENYVDKRIKTRNRTMRSLRKRDPEIYIPL